MVLLSFCFSPSQSFVIRFHAEIDVHTDESAEIVVDALVHTDCVLVKIDAWVNEDFRPLTDKVS